MLVPLVLFVFWIGLYPKPLLDVMHESVDHLLEQKVRVMTVENTNLGSTKTLLLTENSVLASKQDVRIR